MLFPPPVCRRVNGGSQPRWGCEKIPKSALLAVGALACRRLARRERIDRSDATLFEVLVGLRFLLFLVAAHLTLGHDDLPLRPVERRWRCRTLTNSPAFVCRRCNADGLLYTIQTACRCGCSPPHAKRRGGVGGGGWCRIH